MTRFRSEEVATTVVRFVIAAPANWTDITRMLRWAIAEHSGDGNSEPADDALWFEPGDGEIAVCYQLARDSKARKQS